jgi:hypothetical protein
MKSNLTSHYFTSLVLLHEWDLQNDAVMPAKWFYLGR